MEQIAELRAFKAQGGKVIGTACLLTPVEILDAAGLYPFRITARGNARTDQADARMSRFNCGYCRACLQLALEGELDFLDGVIESNGCDQLRGMFENWQYARPSAFFHYLKVPHLSSEDARQYFAGELRRMIAALEAAFEVTIGDDDLWVAIERQERIRELFGRVYAFREGPELRLQGSELVALMVTAGSLRPLDFETLLRELLDELGARPAEAPRGPRLLLGGAATDEVELLREIESLGAAIVVDALCFGSRAFRPMLGRPRAADPLETLVDRYLTASMCPRMYGEVEARLSFILGEVARAEVDGVVLVHNKFCDIHGIDNAMLRQDLEARGVPVLTLEKEYGALADRGRIKTRVQAFMERIGGR
jgi:benzoyl-CoA reductase subunit C